MTRIEDLLRERDESLYAKLQNVWDKVAVPRLQRIVQIFPHYTSHGPEHSKRVMEICSWLAGSKLLESLNALELFVLSLAIEMHDVGMAINEDERKGIVESAAYHDFLSQRSDLERDEALAEFVRLDHHIRGAEYVRDELASSPLGVDQGLANAAALIIQSHGERDLDDFQRFDPFFAWGTRGETLCLPLLGVLLRLSDLLHLTSDRTPLAAVRMARLQSKKSREEWSRHLATVGVAPIPCDRTVRLSCICRSPDVHRDLLQLCDYVNDEFRYCEQVLRRLQHRGHEPQSLACVRMEPNISAEGYQPWLNLRFNLDAEGISRLLAGARLYPGAGSVVKELVINAVDSTRQKAASIGTTPKIAICLNMQNRELVVSDSGEGMSKHEIEEFLLQLGRSIYHSLEYVSNTPQSHRIEPISEFGVGFASCFMAADHVIVETKKDGHEPIELDMYDLMGFVAARTGQRVSSGTTVRLCLKDELLTAIAQSVANIDKVFPHLEMALDVTVDGDTSLISEQPFEHAPDTYAIEPFRASDLGLEIHRRCFNREEHHMRGSIGLLCTVEDDIVLPRLPSRYKMRSIRREKDRLVSQLGFRIPFNTSAWDSLLRQVDAPNLVYDLDLCGKMRFEMNPARTELRNSNENRQVFATLDGHLVDLILQIHNSHWSHLERENKFRVYRLLANVWFPHVLRLLNSRLSPEVVPKLVCLMDLFLECTPFEVHRRGYDTDDFSWNEIRSMDKPVVFLYSSQIRPEVEIERQAAEIHDVLPECVGVNMGGFQPFKDEIRSYANETSVIVSEVVERVFPVMQLWEGNAISLLRMREEQQSTVFSSCVPFLPQSKVAVVSYYAARREGVNNAWLNSSHPKTQRLITALRKLARQGVQFPKTVEFMAFLQREYVDLGHDPDYVEYIQQRQRPAMEELVHLGALREADVETLILCEDDILAWAGPR